MPKLPKPLNRYLFHPLEAAAALVVYSLMRVLSIDMASALGGWLGRTVGPYIPISARAVKNLSAAFPEKSPAEIATIVRAMWDNLGRMAAEYPHLGEINVYDPEGRIEVSGIEYADLLRDDGRGGIFFSGHIGNWEIVSLGATQRGVPLDRVYREANNRLVEWLYQHGRAAVEGALIPKGPAGARVLLRSLEDNRHIAMMVDQKMNDGIPVPFFGRDVMTAPALAELALRYDCPVVPARVERLKGAHFRLLVYPPLELVKTGDRQADVAANMAQVNAILEQWIRDTPEQWLWLHNRWPD
jgi:KDO2-lipid IV(A) lauroyltransferase